MFASCCNWICLDSADVDVSPGGGDRPPRSYTNSAFSSQPTPPPQHACRACGGRLDTPNKKHVCVDCQQSFCGRCSSHLEPRPRLCHTCQRFHGNLLQRAELMKLKVKELRDYLHLHQVSTHLCREKEELVELVLGQQSPSGSSAPQTPEFDPPSSPPMPDIPDAPPPPPPPPPPTSDPAPPEPEAPPTTTEGPAPPEDDLQDEDQVWDPEDAPVSGRRASLSDLSGVDDIEELSVRQLKEILARNFVNYKGCCEKWELMERVTRLYRDQQNLLANSVNAADSAGPGPGLEENLCRICMDSPIDCVLLECGHMVTCTKCGKRMSECPICRQYVIRAVHVFRS
ncbi:E3 ubiquitin-protein ligase rififylin isoform X2 [Cololabis saira]|uniref:E3 ubiquitin-protein ligase rififylin isoform X2 n=1 Tax=Cololabis saira TaxID=129043 RepID=UPI002AD40E66|nr:E3 ubiquitin-protein ligase rififylin isoform X2 [Cololabis saira]